MKEISILNRFEKVWHTGFISVKITERSSERVDSSYQFTVEYKGKLLVDEVSNLEDVSIRRGLEHMEEITAQFNAIITAIKKRSEK